MRTRRTPAPHPSRPRAASLRRVVAAALALPLALGTLAATALPASAAPVGPSITFTAPPLTSQGSNPAIITCPTDSSRANVAAAWQTSSGGWGEGTLIAAESDQVRYSADVLFSESGSNQVTTFCSYPGEGSDHAFSYVEVDPAPPVEVATKTILLLDKPTVSAGTESIAYMAVKTTDDEDVTSGSFQVTIDGGTPIPASALDHRGGAQVTLPGLPAGTYDVRASYQGAKGYLPSHQSATLTVEAAAPVKTTPGVTLDGPSMTEPSFTLTAQVLPSGNGAVPTGKVQFLYDGKSSLGTALLDENGRATLPVSEALPREYTVTAFYAGDENYLSTSSAPRTILVVPKSDPQPNPHRMPSEVKVSAPATAVTGSTVEIKVAVSPGVQWTSMQVAEPAFPTGTAIIELADGAVKRKATLVDGVATFSVVAPAPGSYTVYAYYNGDDIFDASKNSTPLVVTDAVVTPPVVTPPAPVAPEVTVPATVTTSVATQATFTVGFPGKVRPVGTLTVSEGATTLVSSEVPATGDLAVTLPVLTPGTHDLVVRTAASKGVLATEQAVRVTVLGEPAKGSTAPNADLTGSTTTLQTGKKITLVARDFLPGETVAFFLHSDPVFLGTAVADENGVATLVVALPAGVPAGAHHVQATGGTSGRWAEIPVTVTEGTPAVETPVETGPIVTVPVAAPVAPVVAAPAAAAPAAPAAVTAAPLAATGAETGSTALLVGVLLTSGALLLAGRRRFSTSS